jgi:hypothetical protein
MNEQPNLTDPNMTGALEELQIAIRAKYPHAQFEVAPGEDDLEAVHLYTTVDIEDPDDVGDLVLDRVLEFQLQGLPLHVIPIRPTHRIVEEMRARRNEHSSPRRTVDPATLGF